MWRVHFSRPVVRDDIIRRMKMFDLEKVIKQWQRTLRKNEMLEDGYIEELESHLQDEIDHQISLGFSKEEAFKKAVADIGQADSIGTEYYKANTRRLSGHPPWKPPLFMPALIWSYFKLAFRKIKRQKGYSFINIAGLTIGLACAILILIWIQDELSYDRFHENANEIHRVMLRYQNLDSYQSQGPGPLGPALKDEYPEILNSTRVFLVQRNPLKYKDKVFIESVCGTDPSFFQIFTFPFIKGDPENALSDPDSIVLTLTTARKFFENEDPIGKTMGFEWWGRWHDFTITGVIEDVPLNSHIQFDFLLPFNFVTRSGMDIDKWDTIAYHTYVLLGKNVELKTLNEKIIGAIKRHHPESPFTVYLQPLTRIHLHNFAGGGPIVYVYIFSIIGMLILAIACMNFMNLSTARSATRAKEVGIRKVVGSSRLQLVKQLLGESLLMSFIALILALFLTEFMLPYFNNLLGKNMELQFPSSLILSLVGIAIITGIVSGSYPALFLSNFQPAKVLMGSLHSSSKSQLFRKILVVTQFGISIMLIISATVVYKQLKYIRNKDMGIEKECIVNLELRGGLRNQYRVTKRELLQNPDILSVTATNGSFYRRFSTDNANWEGKKEEEKVIIFIHSVDFDYLKTFGLKMADGRYFSREFPTDISDNVIVNETAVKAMGMDSPIGKRFSCPVPYGKDKEGSIIGVVKDFHFHSLHEEIRPLILLIAPGWFADMYIKIKSENIPETVGFLEKTLKKFAPDYPFDYSFLDEDIDILYKTEQRVGSLVRYGTFLALLIACLGLFGLASFTAEQRTKEIGIRKVLGASLSNIALLLTKEFSRWVLIANVIAWPIAYFVMRKWLQNFAYRINIGVEVFFLSALVVLVITLITVSYQSIKAALANPADSLRYE